MGIGTVSIIIAALLPGSEEQARGCRPAGYCRAGRQGDGTVPERQRIMESIKTVVTNRQTWPGFIAFAGLSGSILSFTGMWGVPYIMAVYGLNKAAASSYVMAATAGVMVGSLVSGMTSDKVGKGKVLCWRLACQTWLCGWRWCCGITVNRRWRFFIRLCFCWGFSHRLRNNLGLGEGG